MAAAHHTILKTLLHYGRLQSARSGALQSGLKYEANMELDLNMELDPNMESDPSMESDQIWNGG